MEATYNPRYYFDLRKERKNALKGESAYTPAGRADRRPGRCARLHRRRRPDGNLVEGRKKLVDNAETCAAMTRAAATAMGLKLFAPEGLRSRRSHRHPAARRRRLRRHRQGPQSQVRHHRHRRPGRDEGLALPHRPHRLLRLHGHHRRHRRAGTGRRRAQAAASPTSPSAPASSPRRRNSPSARNSVELYCKRSVKQAAHSYETLFARSRPSARLRSSCLPGGCRHAGDEALRRRAQRCCRRQLCATLSTQPNSPMAASISSPLPLVLRRMGRIRRGSSAWAVADMHRSRATRMRRPPARGGFGGTHGGGGEGGAGE